MTVHILVEGQAEETFVKELLEPYFLNYGIYVYPVLISTKRSREGTKFKGGLTRGNFSNFISDIQKLIYNIPSSGIVSTFIDYYRLPSVFPSYSQRLQFNTPADKVSFLENALFEHLKSPQNFIPYIQLHEFEAFIFSHPIGLQSYIDPSEATIDNLLTVINEYENPEDINEGENTSPSKRILQHYKNYDKVAEGNLMLLEIGMNTLLLKCPHFKNWIDKIVARANGHI